MQAKAEGELSDLRKKEMADAHEFKMIESNLEAEISHNSEKTATATKAKASAEESKATAEGDLAETTKTKAADEEYSATLKTECEMAATEWASRQARNGSHRQSKRNFGKWRCSFRGVWFETHKEG